MSNHFPPGRGRRSPGCDLALHNAGERPVRHLPQCHPTHPNAPPAASGKTASTPASSMTCVLDDWHWETALRYVELNPARARPVPDWPKTAEDCRWSTARAHLSLETPPEWLDTDQFQRRWPTPASWRDSLATLTRREAAAVRRATRPPLGPGLRRLRPKPRAHLQNPPKRPAHWAATQGSSHGNADPGFSKPNRRSPECWETRVPANLRTRQRAFPSNCKSRSALFLLL